MCDVNLWKVCIKLKGDVLKNNHTHGLQGRMKNQSFFMLLEVLRNYKSWRVTISQGRHNNVAIWWRRFENEGMTVTILARFSLFPEVSSCFTIFSLQSSIEPEFTGRIRDTFAKGTPGTDTISHLSYKWMFKRTVIRVKQHGQSVQHLTENMVGCTVSRGLYTLI